MDNNMSNVPAVTTNANIFDEETIEITMNAGGSGLDLAAAGYPGVIWGVVTYKGLKYQSTDIINKKLIVLQLPICPDENGLPIVVWAYANDSFGEKSNFHKHLSAIYGGPIGMDHPIRSADGSGNLDPKKIFGQNCTVNIGDTSNDSKKKMGVTSLASSVAGMQEYQINPDVPMPAYIIDLKNGKDLEPKTGGTAPIVPQVAPVVPTVPGMVQVGTQEPVGPKQQIEAPPTQPVQPVQPQVVIPEKVTHNPADIAPVLQSPQPHVQPSAGPSVEELQAQLAAMQAAQASTPAPDPAAPQVAQVPAVSPGTTANMFANATNVNNVTQ